MSTHNPAPASINYFQVENLRLDPDNPRLAETMQEATQDDLLLELYRSFDLKPLLLSMSQHGYFDEEPLIGVRAPDGNADDECITVVEGNRRLAALQLLLFETARTTVRALALPEVSPYARERLNPVPVKVYPSRDDVVAYLGVRHIRGVKDWNPMAKARYVRRLVDSGMTTREIARSIGVQRGTVRQWLLTLYLLEQANMEADTPWNTPPDEFKFSWLYTALNYGSVTDYLSLRRPKQDDPEPQPVAKDSLPRLDHLMRDLYGPPSGDSQRAKVRDSRELRQLAAVYASPDALGKLRSGVSLKEAYAHSAGEEEELLDHLRQANRHLERAGGIGHRHRSNTEVLRLAEDANGTIAALIKTLKDE